MIHVLSPVSTPPPPRMPGVNQHALDSSTLLLLPLLLLLLLLMSRWTPSITAVPDTHTPAAY